MNIDYPFHIDSRGRSATTGEDDHIRDMIEQFLFTNIPQLSCSARGRDDAVLERLGADSGADEVLDLIENLYFRLPSIDSLLHNELVLWIDQTVTVGDKVHQDVLAFERVEERARDKDDLIALGGDSPDESVFLLLNAYDSPVYTAGV